MQSHDCTNYLRICANFGILNAKQEKLQLISYLSQFDKVFLVSHVFMTFLTHVYVQNFHSQLFDCSKELAFRKSGHKVKLGRRVGGGGNQLVWLLTSPTLEGTNLNYSK